MQTPNHPAIPDSFFLHPNCQQVPRCYFQNLFRLQPLVLLPAGGSHYLLMPGVLQNPPTLSFSFNPRSLGIYFNTAAPVILMKIQVRLYHFCSALLVTSTFTQSKSQPRLFTWFYLFRPPSTPITMASLLFCRYTCQALTSGPLHSHFISKH